MSDDDTVELLALCETILADGELSYDELYRLAEWLNNHPEASFQWPGNLLVVPRFAGRRQDVRQRRLLLRRQRPLHRPFGVLT